MKLRGKLKIKEKYKWCQNDDGTYAIFDVPIFCCLTRPIQKRVNGKTVEETLEVTQADIDGIITNFDRERQRGFYPSAHISHQDAFSAEEQPGVAMLDNLCRHGDVLFSDLCEITEEEFKNFKSGKYPHRSVEGYDPDTKQIAGLALLKSRRPYIPFSILRLEESPSHPADERIFQFQSRRMALNFQEELKLLWTNWIKRGVLNFQDAPKPDDDNAPPPADDKKNFGDGGGGSEAKMDQILTLLQTIAQSLLPASSPGAPAMPSTNAPQPVAMQQQQQQPPPPAQSSEIAQLAQLVREQNANFTKQLQTMKNAQEADIYNKRLQRICEDNPALSANFSAYSAKLQNFTTGKDKEEFVNFVETFAESYDPHPAGKFAFSLSEKDSILNKHHDASPRLQAVAKMALNDYQDSSGSVTNFQQLYPSVQDFVDEAVKREELIPGSYEMIRKGG